MRASLLPAILILLAPPVASSRLMAPWPYAKLFDKADLVVIASARFSEDTSDKWPYPDHRDLRFTGMNTTFEVNHVVKGATDKSKIVVLHFREEEAPPAPARDKEVVEEWIGGPPPLLVRFRGRPFEIKGTKTSVPCPQYMLFLKKLDDDRFEPVSGKYAPLLSVRELFTPLPQELGGSNASPWGFGLLGGFGR